MLTPPCNLRKPGNFLHMSKSLCHRQPPLMKNGRGPLELNADGSKLPTLLPVLPRGTTAERTAHVDREVDQTTAVLPYETDSSEDLWRLGHRKLGPWNLNFGNAIRCGHAKSLAFISQRPRLTKLGTCWTVQGTNSFTPPGNALCYRDAFEPC